MSDASIPACPSPLQPPRHRAHKASDGIYIKRGRHNQIQREVDAINFVRQHTSLSVPSILQVHLKDNDGDNPSSWFTMSTMPGSSLIDAWPNMTEEARGTAQTELRKYLHELRSIPPPTPAYIGSCTGGRAYDHRLNNGWPCGPFVSEAEFNDFLTAPVARCPRKELVDHYRRQMADDHGILFSHADLDGEHIFVEAATGKILGFVDWEMAGWWPAYWEYTKSRIGNKYQPWWKLLITTVLDSYEHEFRIELDLQDFG